MLRSSSPTTTPAFSFRNSFNVLRSSQHVAGAIGSRRQQRESRQSLSLTAPLRPPSIFDASCNESCEKHFVYGRSRTRSKTMGVPDPSRFQQQSRANGRRQASRCLRGRRARSTRCPSIRRFPLRPPLAGTTPPMPHSSNSSRSDYRATTTLTIIQTMRGRAACHRTWTLV